MLPLRHAVLPRPLMISTRNFWHGSGNVKGNNDACSSMLTLVISLSRRERIFFNSAFGVGVKEISAIYVLKVQTVGHSASTNRQHLYLRQKLIGLKKACIRYWGVHFLLSRRRATDFFVLRGRTFDVHARCGFQFCVRRRRQDDIGHLCPKSRSVGQIRVWAPWRVLLKRHDSFPN